MSTNQREVKEERGVNEKALKAKKNNRRCTMSVSTENSDHVSEINKQNRSKKSKHDSNTKENEKKIENYKKNAQYAQERPIYEGVTTASIGTRRSIQKPEIEDHGDNFKMETTGFFDTKGYKRLDTQKYLQNSHKQEKSGSGPKKWNWKMEPH
ncbi:348_t:CDS:2 [Gigaspora rosea]|nr:348_t:CDS:2 [Gigaspora rosea]